MSQHASMYSKQSIGVLHVVCKMFELRTKLSCDTSLQVIATVGMSSTHFSTGTWQDSHMSAETSWLAACCLPNDGHADCRA